MITHVFRTSSTQDQHTSRNEAKFDDSSQLYFSQGALSTVILYFHVFGEINVKEHTISYIECVCIQYTT